MKTKPYEQIFAYSRDSCISLLKIYLIRDWTIWTRNLKFLDLVQVCIHFRDCFEAGWTEKCKLYEFSPYLHSFFRACWRRIGLREASSLILFQVCTHFLGNDASLTPLKQVEADEKWKKKGILPCLVQVSEICLKEADENWKIISKILISVQILSFLAKWHRLMTFQSGLLAGCGSTQMCRCLNCK